MATLSVTATASGADLVEGGNNCSSSSSSGVIAKFPKDEDNVPIFVNDPRKKEASHFFLLGKELRRIVMGTYTGIVYCIFTDLTHFNIF